MLTCWFRVEDLSINQFIVDFNLCHHHQMGLAAKQSGGDRASTPNRRPQIDVYLWLLSHLSRAIIGHNQPKAHHCQKQPGGSSQINRLHPCLSQYMQVGF